jgi:hypothetical protein
MRIYVGGPAGVDRSGTEEVFREPNATRPGIGQIRSDHMRPTIAGAGSWLDDARPRTEIEPGACVSKGPGG